MYNIICKWNWFVRKNYHKPRKTSFHVNRVGTSPTRRCLFFGLVWLRTNFRIHLCVKYYNIEVLINQNSRVSPTNRYSHNQIINIYLIFISFLSFRRKSSVVVWLYSLSNVALTHFEHPKLPCRPSPVSAACHFIQSVFVCVRFKSCAFDCMTWINFLRTTSPSSVLLRVYKFRRCALCVGATYSRYQCHP